MARDDRKEGRPLTPDGLRGARRLVATLAVVTGLGVLASAVIAGWASRRQAAECHALTRALSLSVPAWVPSGRGSRQPASLRRGIDLRHSPWLPAFDPGPERLLLPPPAQDGSGP